MNLGGFGKFYWGFLFIMLDFKIQGVDILPDIIGYIFFAVGFSVLAGNSINFKKAGNFNIAMIIISVFSIYEKPAQNEGVQFGPLGILGIPITIAIIVISLMVVYYLFMGIKDMAQMQGQIDIYQEADNRWKQFLYLQLAVLIAFVLIFIPPLAIVYIIVMFIISLIITIKIMQFMKKCGEYLNRNEV